MSMNGRITYSGCSVREIRTWNGPEERRFFVDLLAEGLNVPIEIGMSEREARRLIRHLRAAIRREKEERETGLQRMTPQQAEEWRTFAKRSGLSWDFMELPANGVLFYVGREQGKFASIRTLGNGVIVEVGTFYASSDFPDSVPDLSSAHFRTEGRKWFSGKEDALQFLQVRGEVSAVRKYVRLISNRGAVEILDGMEREISRREKVLGEAGIRNRKEKKMKRKAKEVIQKRKSKK